MSIRPEFINGLAPGPGEGAFLDALASGVGALALAADTLRLLVTLQPVLLTLGPALLGWAALLRWKGDRRVGRAALAAGASRTSARFAARALRALPVAEALSLFDAPELLAHALAERLRTSRDTEAADELATAARRLLEEIDGRWPVFEGAPMPFDRVCLGDGSDTHGIHQGWVCAVDERNLSVIAHQRCPWPVRTLLIVSRPGCGQPPFAASLLLRPMPGHHEWVLSHELGPDQGNRRSGVRVPVEIQSWSLDPPGHKDDDTRGVTAARNRLRRGNRLTLGRLRRTEAWARRHRIRLRDLSKDGALLDIDHDVSPGDRFFVVIPADEAFGGRGVAPEVRGRPNDDLRVAALPLAEAVSVRLGTGGRLVVGTRFCEMRFHERTAMETLVKRAAARHRQARRSARLAAERSEPPDARPAPGA